MATINRKNLVKALTICTKLHSHSPNVLKKAQFISKNGKLYLLTGLSDNMSQSVIAELSECEEEINCVIDLKSISDIAKSVKSENIGLEKELYNGHDRYKVTSGNSLSFDICPEMFEMPAMPEIPDKKYVNFNNEEFKTAFSFVEKSVSVDEYRQYLMQIIFDFEQKRLFSTDGHRMHIAPLRFSGERLPKFGAMSTLNTRVLREMIKKDASNMVLFVTENSFCIEKDNVTFLCAFTEYDAPPVDRVVPKDFTNEIILSTKALSDALTLIKKQDCIVMQISNDKLVLKTEDGLTQSINLLSSNIAALDPSAQPEISIGMNPKYLLDCMADSKTCVLRFADCDRDFDLYPILLERDNGSLGVLMPHRLKPYKPL
jgi:DNA polymerase III sliding clamp (beta) subunit (PCNA family)